MLERFRAVLDGREVSVEIRQADVLAMDSLPGAWTDYDLIVTASMLEYVPGHVSQMLWEPCARGWPRTDTL
jgi:hypothetical protein